MGLNLYIVMIYTSAGNNIISCTFQQDYSNTLCSFNFVHFNKSVHMKDLVIKLWLLYGDPTS